MMVTQAHPMACFIHAPDSIDVSNDDLVRVHGKVKENHGETRLVGVNFVSICRPAAPVAPVALDLPVTAQSNFEPYEGMLVTFPENLSVTEHYDQGRYGEVWVSSDGQLFDPPTWQIQAHLPKPWARPTICADC